MNGNAHSVYEFGEFQIDTHQRVLSRNGDSQRISPKAFEILVLLVSRANEVVSKEEIMSSVWSDSFVEEANLSVHISALRKLLSKGSEVSATIETFPKVGYRFSTTVRLIDPKADEQLNRKDARRPTPSNREDLPKQTAPSRWKLVLMSAAAVVAIVLGSSFAINRYFSTKETKGLTMFSIPGLENSSAIAISPDGQSIASSLTKEGKYSLVVTNVSSGSRIQVVPPSDFGYLGITFSKDSSFLFYVTSGPTANALYKIPILGGEPLKISDGVGARISFSPDGSRFAFVRQLSEGQTAIVLADKDGSNTKLLATKNAPEYFSAGEIAWSPNGRTIANAAGNSKQSQSLTVVGIDTETGAEVPLVNKKWAGIDGLSWHPQGDRLIGGFFDQGNSPTQVLQIEIPSGEIKTLTTDTFNYGSVDITSDGKTILAGQFKDHRRIWFSPNDGTGLAKPLTTERKHDFRWFRWAGDSKIVFGSDANGNRDVWIMDSDGTNERQLTIDMQNNVMPVGSVDGRYIVFASNRTGNGIFNLWRIETGGENPVQLTSGTGENQPEISKDGRWVFYTLGGIDGPKPERSVWKVSIDGGEPSRVIEGAAFGPAVSPDGRFVAVWSKGDGAKAWRVVILPIDGGTPVESLEVPDGPPVRWAPNGKGISFLKTQEGVSNVWTQPIDGTAPFPETRFTSERISHFDWSIVGRLAVARTFRTSDIVLIRNFD